MMFPAFPVVLPYAGGKLRVLALTSEQRSPRLPETPTMGEAGFPGVTQLSWFGLHAPAATPKAVVDRLYAETARLLQDPSLRERFASEGLTPVGSSPEEFSRFVSGEISRWKRVVKDGKIKLDS